MSLGYSCKTVDLTAQFWYNFSKFMADFEVLFREVVPEVDRDFDWNDPEHDEGKKYTVDCRINGMPEPLFVYALANNDRIRDATIKLQKIMQWKIPFRPLGIFQDREDAFCLQTRLKSCHQEDIEKLESELENIRGNDIYQKLKDARNHTVAHTHTSYKEYGATQKALLEDAIYLIKRENRFKNFVSNIKSLIHHVEMSVRKKEGKPLNVATFTIQIQVPK